MTLIERSKALRDYIESAGPVVWGESDCCAFPAKWIERVTGKRVPYPKYTTREEAHTLMAKSGGSLVRLCERWLAPLNLPLAIDPQLGDVGVIRLSDKDVGVIFCQGGIAAWRCEQQGVAFIRPYNVLAAWAV
jgi:hypothetical protein